VKKRIDVAHLRIGMHVVELDRPWLETPLLFQSFQIRDKKEIEQLQGCCQYVYVFVDERGGFTSPYATLNTGYLNYSQPAPQRTPFETNQQRIELELLRQAARPVQESGRYEDAAEAEQEVTQVEPLYTEALSLRRALLHDARLGNPLNTPAAHTLVSNFVESAIRNPDALMYFALIRGRDSVLAEHVLRCSLLALVVGRHMGLDRGALNELGIAALLHDVGKVRLPREILHKTESLTDEERQLVERHVGWGVEILRANPGISPRILEAVGQHHERYDGNGYPAGRRAGMLGEFGQVLAMVDYYDHLTQDGAPLSAHTALKRLYTLRGTQFAPELVEQFIQCMGIYPIGSVVELDNGAVGVVVALNRKRRLKPRVAIARSPDGSPVEPGRLMNLLHDKDESGQMVAIERVVEPEAANIDPFRYLPVTGATF
jgi:HD-GYP domain-containing protein (c-di-GMP phosphodiesterase class II)